MEDFSRCVHELTQLISFIVDNGLWLWWTSKDDVLIALTVTQKLPYQLVLVTLWCITMHQWPFPHMLKQKLVQSVK